MIKLFEMFSGYGGASFALKKAGIEHEVVGYSEIDKYAIQCYEQNHKGKNYGDCSKIDTRELPDFDLLTGGFPCQDVSIAGKRDLNKGRTNLYQEILRVAQDKKPRYMLLENVKGLLSMKVDERALHLKIVNDLEKLGYGVCWKVLNSKDYGIPQNRERIWFVCKLGGWDFMEFQFPPKERLKIFLKDILEKEIDKKYYLSEESVKRLTKRNNIKKEDGTINTLTSTMYKVNWNTPLTKENTSYIQYDFGNHSQQDRIYNTECISPTIVQNVPSILNNKTRDVEIAINVAQDIANKENKPVQLDLMHLKNGEIRPLTTYIPQDFDVHRCLQSGEPKEILIEPKILDCYNHKIKEDICPTLSDPCHNNLRLIEPIPPSRIRDTQKSESFITSWDLKLFGEVSEKEKEVLECWRFNHRLIKYGKLSVGNGMSLGDLQSYFSWNIEDTIKTILEKGYLILKKDNKFYANSCRKVAGMFGAEFISYPNGWSPTIMANSSNNSLMEKNTIRRLTPRECFRLMGFLNDEINLDNLSDTQKYKLAGNGWCIQTVSKIFEQMFKNTKYLNNAGNR